MRFKKSEEIYCFHFLIACCMFDHVNIYHPVINQIWIFYYEAFINVIVTSKIKMAVKFDETFTPPLPLGALYIRQTVQRSRLRSEISDKEQNIEWWPILELKMCPIQSGCLLFSKFEASKLNMKLQRWDGPSSFSVRSSIFLCSFRSGQT